MSKIVNRFSMGMALTVGVAMVAFYQSDTTIEDVGENIALKLMEILPRKHKTNMAMAQEAEPQQQQRQQEQQQEEEVLLSKASIFNPVGSYNAKKAMDLRHEGLKEVCKKYSDFLRPEHHMSKTKPNRDIWEYHVKSDTIFCPIQQVAMKSYQTLFSRVKEIGEETSGRRKLFLNQYPRSARSLKKAIMVRHPLERLISTYRHHYEKRYNAQTDQQEGGDLSFADFVYILLDGPIEYADFLDENKLDGESVAIDTGMIDGKGESNRWNPYWLQCGVCNPNLMPDLILHMDHHREDAKVLIEQMDRPDGSDHWAKTTHENNSGWREVEEYYYSQLTKSQIKQLYEKYKADHELFGFTPEYYVAMGNDGDDSNDEEEEEEMKDEL